MTGIIFRLHTTRVLAAALLAWGWRSLLVVEYLETTRNESCAQHSVDHVARAVDAYVFNRATKSV